MFGEPVRPWHSYGGVRCKEKRVDVIKDERVGVERQYFRILYQGKGMEFGKAIVPSRVSLLCGENVERAENDVKMTGSKVLDGCSFASIRILQNLVIGKSAILRMGSLTSSSHALG